MSDKHMTGEPTPPEQGDPYADSIAMPQGEGRDCAIENPTTGEWAADYVADRFTIDASSAGQIADAHNAAIAAEERRANDSIEENVRLMNKLAAAREKVQELEGWKESAISVMPDFQAIGKELGLQIGESVHDKILPAIQQWAWLTVKELLREENIYEAVADAHNAALDVKQQGIDVLRFQLAAERERADNAEARYASLHTMEADALREQVAAAVEALRQIATVEANDPDEVAAGLKQTQSYEIADAALAKIKK